jgi:hypothetical protein
MQTRLIKLSVLLVKMEWVGWDQDIWPQAQAEMDNSELYCGHLSPKPGLSWVITCVLQGLPGGREGWSHLLARLRGRGDIQAER